MGAPDSSVIPWRAQPRSTSAQAAQVTTGWKASKKKNTNITRSRLHTMGKRYGLLQLPFRVNCAQNLPGFFRRLNWNTNSIFHTGPSHVFILCILLLSEEVPTAPAHGSWQRVVKLTHKKTCKGTRTEIGHVMTCCHFDGHRFSCIQPSQHNRKQNIYIYIYRFICFSSEPDSLSPLAPNSLPAIPPKNTKANPCCQAALLLAVPIALGTNASGPSCKHWANIPVVFSALPDRPQEGTSGHKDTGTRRWMALNRR